MERTLGSAKVGSTVTVIKIEGDGAYKRRIMDMGITKGSRIYIRKVAPLGDPVEVTVRVVSKKRGCKMCPCRNCIVGGRTKWRSGLHLPEIRTVERRQCLMRLREQINMSETGRELR